VGQHNPGRGKKSAHDAVDEIANALHQGYTQVIDADLSKYFDSIPHSKLLAVVAERIVDSAILHVIKLWLKAPVIGEDKDGTRKNVGGGKANSKGTPQGGVISPLLSNCYLHVLDRIWEKHQLRWKLKARIVRYADDFVVLCAGKVDAPLSTVRQVLDRLDLTLNETKTRIVDARQESFNFLGFEIRVSKGLKSGKSYPHVCPAPKSLAKIKKSYNAIDRTRVHADTVGEYCLEYECHPSRVVELLSLPQFQWCTGEGENACRRAPANPPDEAPQGQGSWNRQWSFPESTALYEIWAIQGSDSGGLENGACLV